MSRYETGLTNKILHLLRDGSEVIGMKLCFRHIDHSLGLPTEWRLHVASACLIHKNNPREQKTCANFADDQTNRDMMGHPEGMIRCCPFGFTEILTPVMVDGMYAGPLFAGPCWLHKTHPPDKSLVIPPHDKWLSQRLSILNCIATKLAGLLQSGITSRPLRRRQQILKYINDTIHDNVSLIELSRKLNLSPSRTTHLVRELFNTSLPLLSRQHKLLQAAAELIATDLPIGEISLRYGFLDQNYFSRIFSEHFSISPRNYRRQHSNNA